MAKKKRALKAEVIDEAGDINLSGTTRLDFSLTKNDIIDYYLQEQEDELETSIKTTLQNIEDLAAETDDLRNTFDQTIISTVISTNKTLIKNVKKALGKLSALGFRPALNGNGNNSRVSVNFNGLQITYHPLPAFSWGRTGNYGHNKPLGAKLPPDLWNSDGYSACQFFAKHNKTYKLLTDPEIAEKSSVATLNVGGAFGPATTIEWDEKLSLLADTYVQKLNDKAAASRELFSLMLKHDSLPSLKKQIKKQVVGRVLKNTDEGRLMLEALKGIRNAGTSLISTVSDS